MQFFDIISNLFYKGKEIPEMNTSWVITLNKWLSRDRHSIGCIKRCLPYALYIEPIHYYYLLYLSLPKRKPPYIKKLTKVKEKDNKLLDKVQYILGWSDRELKYNERILSKTVLQNKKYWKKELGVGRV